MKHTLILIAIICSFTPTIAQKATDINDTTLLRLIAGEHFRQTEPTTVISKTISTSEIVVRFNKNATIPLYTNQKLDAISDSLRAWTGMPHAKVTLFADKINLRKLVATTQPIASSLYGRNIALWNSHGRYYEASLDRWEWQRARLFNTVEDLLSSSFVLPYLTPMLENAGATVFMPRERDMNPQQYEGNSGEWIKIDKPGRYYVYARRDDSPVSFPLGNFYLEDSAMFCNNGRKIVVGGGMGKIARGGRTSGLPAWAEGARYYLEAQGYPKEVYAIRGNDYTDDINARGEWVNYLIKTENIPIDCVVALHTDAGIAQADSTIGSLAIVCTDNMAGKFSNGRDKRASRDLADAILREIDRGITTTWDSCWSQRGIWDKRYSEAYRPDAPAVLLELLSHQNLNDMRLAQHPQFRFDISRRIYIGILKFLTGDGYVAQPLPVGNMGMRADTLLCWQPTADPLEPSARADSFSVYMDYRLVAQTADTACQITIPRDGKLHVFQVIAQNAGGRSFPSLPLQSCRFPEATQNELYVEGFDRLSAPSIVCEPNYSGFTTNDDPGVPYIEDRFKTGEQYDFDPQSPWLDDDCPGHGASFANWEMKSFDGSYSTKPSPLINKLLQDSVSFISQSKPFFESDTTSLAGKKIYIHLGRNRSTWYGNQTQRHAIWTNNFLARLESQLPVCSQLLIQGAYVGADIPDEATANRIASLLHFKHRTTHASRASSLAASAIEPVKGAKTIERYPDSGMSAAIQSGKITVIAH